MTEEVTPTSEVSGLMLVLYLGGVESTAGLTGNLFKLLAENPDQRALLQRDPALIPVGVKNLSLRPGTTVLLTAETGGVPAARKRLRLKSFSRASLVLRFRQPGTYSVVVRAGYPGGSVSTRVTVDVLPAAQG